MLRIEEEYPGRTLEGLLDVVPDDHVAKCSECQERCVSAVTCDEVRKDVLGTVGCNRRVEAMAKGDYRAHSATPPEPLPRVPPLVSRERVAVKRLVANLSHTDRGHERECGFERPEPKKRNSIDQARTRRDTKA